MTRRPDATAVDASADPVADSESIAFFNAVVAESGLGATTVERIPEDDVLRLLAERYWLSGTLDRIATEKDDTFRLTTADRDVYLVKVSPTEEDPRIVDLQTSVMRHIAARAPQLPVPRIVTTTDGDSQVVIPVPEGPHSRILRVMQFIQGDTLSRVTPTGEQMRKIGAMLAHVSLALMGFEHPSDKRLVLWDVANFHRLGVLRDHLSDPTQLGLTDHVFDAYHANVVPMLGSLQTQVIHGDYSPFNVVVDPDAEDYVTGVIDFGDTVRSAVIFDISVGMANQLDSRLTDPWDRALSFLTGYRTVRDLPAAEAELLAFTVPARLLMRGLITAWRASQNPERHDYLMSHADRDWDNLAAALEMPTTHVKAQLNATAPQKLTTIQERIR